MLEFSSDQQRSSPLAWLSSVWTRCWKACAPTAQHESTRTATRNVIPIPISRLLLYSGIAFVRPGHRRRACNRGCRHADAGTAEAPRPAPALSVRIRNLRRCSFIGRLRSGVRPRAPPRWPRLFWMLSSIAH